MAWSYDVTSALYSLGRIGAAKRSSVETVKAGDRVLFAGAGSGAEALVAARKGGVVTCIDLSPGLIKRAEQKFAREGLALNAIIGDVTTHEHDCPYDVVVANFFLNVFRLSTMRQVLRALVGMMNRGGRLAIADFTAPVDVVRYGLPARFFRWVYHGFANTAFWLSGLCPLHEAYDYAAECRAIGLDVETSKYFSLGIGPPVFVVHTAKLPSDESSS